MNKCKVLGSTVALVLISNLAFAQGSFFSVSSGYGLPLFPRYGLLTDITTTDQTTTEENNAVSLGQGVNLAVSYGYMFTKTWGIEFEVQQLFGQKFESRQDYNGFASDNSLRGNMLQFNPMFVINLGKKRSSWKPYVKLGPMIGLAKMEAGVVQTSDGSEIVFEYEYTGGVSAGYNAVCGVTYGISRKLEAFGEIEVVSASYSPRKAKMTKATNNGDDILETLPVYQKEIEFVNSVEEVNFFPVPVDQDEPRKVLKQDFPFSSIGINLGLRFII